MRVLFPLSVVACSLLPACAPEAPAREPEPSAAQVPLEAPEAQAVPRVERIAADLARARPALERMQASGFLAPVLEAIGALLAQDAANETWHRVESGGLRGSELVLFQRYNTLEPKPGQLPQHEETADIFRRYSESLARHGIALLVVPVPTRLEVSPDRLPGIVLPQPFEGLALATLRCELAMMESGVEVLDLLPTFVAARLARTPDQDKVYLDTDSHWTPRGVQLAAELTARRLASMQGFEPGELREGVDYELRRERLSWRYPRLSQDDPEWVTAPVELSFTRVLGPDGAPAHRSDSTCPILVVGDSYAARFVEEGGDFASLLSVELGLWVDAIRIPGGGVETGWRALARRDLSGKRVIVWLASARTLSSRGLQFQPLFPEDRPRSIWGK